MLPSRNSLPVRSFGQSETVLIPYSLPRINLRPKQADILCRHNPRKRPWKKENREVRGVIGCNSSVLTPRSEGWSTGSGTDSPFGEYCTDKALIWRLYMEQAKMWDDNLANIFNSDLDPLLIFAGLFSAILSAFLIEVRKGLQEDLQSITNSLLIALIQDQRNGQIPSTAFRPSSSSRWVNGLWFSSLMFSLMSALGASLAKGWITQFSSTGFGTRWREASIHCERLRGTKRWHLKLIVQCLPMLIHVAFFLFTAGLIVLL
ncbi:hypothetical protein C8R43DRAFT_908574, partial [Mycena crocata]